MGRAGLGRLGKILWVGPHSCFKSTPILFSPFKPHSKAIQAKNTIYLSKCHTAFDMCFVVVKQKGKQHKRLRNNRMNPTAKPNNLKKRKVKLIISPSIWCFIRVKVKLLA